REMAPAAATRDMYLVDGKVDTQLSVRGPLAVGVPGALAAYERAINQCGTQSLASLLLPAANIAEEGFPIDRVYAGKLASKASELAMFSGSAEVLLKPDGSPFRSGETLRQTDLANSYRQIAEHGPAWFYEGEFAKAVGDWMAENDGILTAADFAGYKTVEREPIVTTYRDWQIVGFPPPSSGGVHVAQILNILEHYDLKAEFEKDPVRGTHLVVEAMKLAFADRAYWLGDPDYAKVPRGLVEKSYAKELAAKIDPTKASEVPQHGNPPDAKASVFERHTTHIAAADSEGYWVAITATINTSFGSKVIVPGTGIVLNNEMDDFSSAPGVANAFGLIGAENNAVAAGKRPLSSMSPTIVLDKQGEPVMTLGAAGGPKIITQVLNTTIRTLDLEQDLSDAVAAPRFHHQWRPDLVQIESTLEPEIVAGLKAMGHEMKVLTANGITQAIGLDDEGNFIGVHDPRIPGKVGYGSR
ncbi:MAG: gamma-glutamyltransferase, partial [Lacipirellulaceae bacterium]